MRRIALLLALTPLACSNNAQIAPDPTKDGGSVDGGPLADGSPDGSVPGDAGSPDGSAPKPASYTSGTRLRTRYITGSDGSKQLVGFYDSTLKVECGFFTAGDSKTRCIPLGGNNAAAVQTALYADSGCTQPVVVSQYPYCPTFAYGADQTPVTSCGTGYIYRVYALGAKLTTFYQKSGSCTAYAVPATQQMWAVGAEIQPSQFVEGTYSTE